MMKLNGIKTLVVGLGKTGIATARFLVKKGAIVTVTDMKSLSELREVEKEMDSLGVRLEAGGHKIESFLQSDVIIPSPGVPQNSEFLVRAREHGVRIISEIELAYQFTNIPIIGVTGTNGKSTVVTLLGEMFRRSRMDVFVGGNLGVPFIEAVDSSKPYQYAILEISSFQLEWIDKFRPYVAVLLNVTQDHLERYPDFQTYFDTKKKIFMNQKRSDFAVLNADDVNVRGLIKEIKARTFLFSSKEKLRKGAYLSKDRIVYAVGNIINEINIKNIPLKGLHNLENIMACVIVASLCNCDDSAIVSTINEFKGLPHRIQFVKEISGVKYYDDSKGTNVDAVIRALDCFSSPVVLIAGGRDKESDFTPLREPVKKKVKAIILIGEAKEKMAEQLKGTTEIIIAEDMKDAVEKARNKARKGDVVLLSPGCASQDMFRDYAERGEVFSYFVKGMEENK